MRESHHLRRGRLSFLVLLATPVWRYAARLVDAQDSGYEQHHQSATGVQYVSRIPQHREIGPSRLLKK